jgi:hypothetical protein
MTDEELIELLRDRAYFAGSMEELAADRIEQLVNDNQRWKMECEEFWRKREDAAEANLAKALVALRFYADVRNYDDGIVGTTHEAPMWSESDFTQFEWDNGDKARAVLAELEKTE